MFRETVSPGGKVYLARFNSQSQIADRLQQAFSWIGNNVLKSGSRVFIKPNLTYPFYKPGVTTSPQLMEAVVQVLADTTRRITFVESDGGAYAWSTQQAMVGHGLPELCRRYGVGIMNLTERPRRTVSCEIDHQQISVELSAEMLEECDLFITMPVPKVHVMTYLSLGFKNQWGCIPDVKRLRHHAQFDYMVLAVNQALRTRLAIYDGSYFLNRTGPMDGDPVKKDMLIVSDGVGAGDLVCCEIMGISPQRSGHLRLAQKIGMMPNETGQIALNCDVAPFQTERFYLKRSLINWITLAVFHNSVATQLVYDSGFAAPIHELLYLIRGRPKDMLPRW